MRHKILIIGREIPYALTNHLMGNSVDLNFVRQVRKERFREMMQVFEPKGIIFMEMLFESDARHRAHMILETSKTPMLVTGNFTWSDYVVIRSPHVHFSPVITPEEALSWIKCACR